jgi:hypothetical protein
MGNNPFKYYIVKVLDDNETKILQDFLLVKSKGLIDMHHFSMLYMPNIKITTSNLHENNQKIYYLANKLDPKAYQIKFDTFAPQQHFVGYIDFDYLSYGCYGCNCDKYTSVYNAIKKRLQYIFYTFYQLFIIDIAKYIIILSLIYNINTYT